MQLPSEGALLVSYPADLRWCTGFTGSNSCLLILEDEEHLITDGRYAHQAAIECPEIQVRIHPGSAIRAATDMLDDRPVSTVLVQADRVSWSEVQHIR
ncbi:MAG: aminopeptidase P family N-terminal domain-containing protein, partial [Bacteroidota bacterium]|nr:aminopeptidase P family N-terminal domain-containing protein [Bacteroidota bacterium]